MSDLVVLKPEYIAAYFNFSSKYHNWLFRLYPGNIWLPEKKLNDSEIMQIEDYQLEFYNYG
jgi:hypothetical protein